MVTAIFPAAGKGSRMNSDINKIFLPLSGKPILIRTLEKFTVIDKIKQFIIAASAEEVESVEKLIAEYFPTTNVNIVQGGAERQFSIYNCLKLVPPESKIVLVHDAARPLISQTVIEKIIAETEKFDGVIAAVPEKNTIKFATNMIVEKTIPRSNLWQIQTPQAFKREIIFRAYESALTDNFIGTDDSSLVERLGVKIKIVKSDSYNIKITTPDDLIIAEHFLNHLKEVNR